MRTEFNDDFIYKILYSHYSHIWDVIPRDLHKHKFKDSHGNYGSIHWSIDGSPPKGYAIYIIELQLLSFYDVKGKRFSVYENINFKEGDNYG